MWWWCKKKPTKCNKCKFYYYKKTGVNECLRCAYNEKLLSIFEKEKN